MEVKTLIFQFIGIVSIASSLIFVDYLSELGNWQSIIGWFIFWIVVHIFMEWRLR